MLLQLTMVLSQRCIVPPNSVTLKYGAGVGGGARGGEPW